MAKAEVLFNDLARKSTDVISDTVQLLSEQKVVGWFQGKNEFGQRALGNRSIIADPRSPSMKDKINKAIKFREAFRPFAPVVLEEKADKYFVTPGHSPVHFIKKVYMFIPEMRNEVGAVIHEDRSGRLQTVNRELNPIFYDLFYAFGKQTGVPIVLNTSFNLSGEPIVQAPEDAIKTFFSSKMNAVVLGNLIIEKKSVGFNGH